MSTLDEMQAMDPRVQRIKINRNDLGLVGWELFDDAEQLLGYGFRIKVPQESSNMNIAVEFDIYDIYGIVDLDFKVVDLNIYQHEDFTNDLWVPDAIEEKFKSQYVGLTAEEIKLAPAGSIDAITDGTISSRMITEAIRVKISAMAQSLQ